MGWDDAATVVAMFSLAYAVLRNRDSQKQKQIERLEARVRELEHERSCAERRSMDLLQRMVDMGKGDNDA
jgi:uncharacterized membrane protein YebE (DUF533 family)